MDANGCAYEREGTGTEADPHVIYSFGDDEEYLLVLDDAGAWYTNQTGGCACNHPQAQGRLVKLAVPEAVKDELYDRYGGISEQAADICNEAFMRKGWLLEVDRDRLAQSEEAWLHVVNHEGVRGILTWENSD